MTGITWTAFKKTNGTSTKPVTHRILERQDQKLSNTHTGKYILLITHYTQRNLISTLTHSIINSHQSTGKNVLHYNALPENAKYSNQ